MKERPSITLLIAAFVASLLASFVPFGHWVLYPFDLFGTFVHESCHALAAVMTGGRVEGMHVSWDTSGLTKTWGGWNVAISTAGYLGSVVVGAALLLAARRATRAQATLVIVGAATMLATLAFAGYGSKWVAMIGAGLGGTLLAVGVQRRSAEKSSVPALASGGAVLLATTAYIAATGGLLTWAVGAGVGLVTLGVGAFAGRSVSHAYLMFLGAYTTLDSLRGLKMLFSITVSSGDHTDALNMAQFTGIPATFWAVLWAFLGLWVVAGALWLFARDARELRS
ncbi:MAG: M50 family metallopeptidase [bacterium]